MIIKSRVMFDIGKRNIQNEKERLSIDTEKRKGTINYQQPIDEIY